MVFSTNLHLFCVVLVHLTAKQLTNPQEDFKHIINNLFTLEPDEPNKPTVLWSCYFSLPLINNLQDNQSSPKNLFICEGPDLDLDYDTTIAKVVFLSI